jgi:hypothetical protein
MAESDAEDGVAAVRAEREFVIEGAPGASAFVRVAKIFFGKGKAVEPAFKTFRFSWWAAIG